MKIWDNLKDWQQRTVAILFFLGLIWAVFAKMDTPFHMDAEAGEIQSAQACGAVATYRLWIAKAKAQLNNPNIPEWKKNELRNSIQEWQAAIDEILRWNKC